MFTARLTWKEKQSENHLTRSCVPISLSSHADGPESITATSQSTACGKQQIISRSHEAPNSNGTVRTIELLLYMFHATRACLHCMFVCARAQFGRFLTLYCSTCSFLLRLLSTRLAQEEAKLEQIVTQQGGNVTSFMGLVDENAKTVKELKVTTSLLLHIVANCLHCRIFILKRRVPMLDTGAYFVYTSFMHLHFFRPWSKPT